MEYHSTRQGCVFTCSASVLIDAKPRDVIEAHTLEKNAAKFRDVRRYSKYRVDGDGVVCVEFPAKVGFFSFTQKFCKRATRDAIKFWTPDDGLSRIRGAWTFEPTPSGKTLVKFHQVVKIPAWGTILPIESYIRNRVVRMMEDTAAL